MANKIRCYLCEAIQSAKDSGEGWRKTITPKLEELGVYVLNPNKIEKSDIHHTAVVTQRLLKSYIEQDKWNQFDTIMRTIQRRDFKAVKSSDFLLVYLDPDVKYGGTVAEIERARDMHIPVFGVCEKKLADENNWVIYTLRDSDGKIFKTFDEFLLFLKDQISLGEI